MPVPVMSLKVAEPPVVASTATAPVPLMVSPSKLTPVTGLLAPGELLAPISIAL
jgi:hypothetical protein